MGNAFSLILMMMSQQGETKVTALLGCRYITEFLNANSYHCYNNLGFLAVVLLGSYYNFSIPTKFIEGVFAQIRSIFNSQVLLEIWLGGPM